MIGEEREITQKVFDDCDMESEIVGRKCWR